MKKLIGYGIIVLLVVLVSGCTTRRGDKKFHIEYMFPGSPDIVKRNTELVKLFEKENPEIEVKLTNEPDWARYTVKVLTRVAGGMPPDLICNSMMDSSRFVRKGLIRPLDDLITADPEMQKLIADIYPQSIYTNALYKGHTYLLPAWQNPAILFYNLKIFQEAGIPEPDYTWDIPHLMKVAQKLTRDLNGDGRFDQFGFLYDIWNPDAKLWPWGLSSFNKDFTRCLINTEPVIKRLEWWQKQTDRYHAMPSLAEKADRIKGQMFMTGKVAMMVGMSYRKNLFLRNKDLQWRMTLWAKGPVRRTAHNDVVYWGMLKSTKYPEAVWRFMKFLLGPESQRIHVKTGDIPVLKTVLNENLHWVPGQPPKSNQAMYDSLAYSAQESFFWDREIFDVAWREMDPALVLVPPQKTVRAASMAAYQAVERLLKERQANAEQNGKQR